MVEYLKYVLRRTLLVLGVLAIGLLGWPGDVGAESLLNFGKIDSSGARRIRVEPRAPATPAPKEMAAGSAGSAARGLRALWGMFGAEAPDQEGPAADAAETDIGAAGEVAAAAAEDPVPAQAKPGGRGAALFAEFGAKSPPRTPYEVSRAALAAAR